MTTFGAGEGRNVTGLAFTAAPEAMPCMGNGDTPAFLNKDATVCGEEADADTTGSCVGPVCVAETRTRLAAAATAG